jgi:hypothetical protein
VENSIDWVASRRDIGVGGMSRRRNPGREPEAVVVITGILNGVIAGCRRVFGAPAN